AVVKPRLHWQPAMAKAPGWTPAAVIDSPSHLRHAVRRMRACGRDPLIQEPIQGQLMAISAVRGPDGASLALMQQHSVGTWPARAGVSSRAITVPVDPALGRGVTSLLDHLGWVGMAQVQFVRPKHGPPRLIDLNGRPYGSLPLAQSAGLNLVSLWLNSWLQTDPTQGHRPSATLTARPGATYSKGVADLRRAIQQRRGGLVCDLVATTRAWWGASHPVADRNDLRPLARVLRPTLPL
ncbi:MAG: ATP-grasp domain-containing protein, partial [Ornithinimicrobium sp.]